eukprot:6959420-Pyramimonas_sp.AAC.1
MMRRRPRKRRSTTKAMCSVVPPGDADEARGGSPIHDQTRGPCMTDRMSVERRGKTCPAPSARGDGQQPHTMR